MEMPILQLNGVCKSFTTERGLIIVALEDVHLDVPANDFICLLGPSGCGKSTLLRIVAGLEKATSGNVLFHGKPHVHPTRHIGMVFQEYSLLPWRTVEDNVALGLEFAGVSKKKRLEKAHAYLEIVGLFTFRKAFPYELSGGMQQRVAIARALAVDPEVLLMDEPFGALDAYTRILLQRQLLDLWEKHRKTVLFVTHSVDEAIFLGDRIAVFATNPGRLIEIEPVPLPRPRNRSNPIYGRLVDRYLDMLEKGSRESNTLT